jgi:DNA repair protein RadC
MNHIQKPREKLITFGPKSLSDDELLAALIGNGIKGHNVFALSKCVLKVIDDRNGSLSRDVL